MARIMCTQRLWQRLGWAGRPPLEVPEPTIHGVVLGSWAAKVCRIDRRDLVIALNERTYLTVVFPLAPRREFRANFAGALSDVLKDLRFHPDIVRSESAAMEFHLLARLTNRSMTGTLNDLEFHCGIELSYHDDLRTVQWNLNQIPHAHREPCVPIDATKRLFEGLPAERSRALFH
jgi:hypothetical protein